jgi:hypothetical protein
VWSPDGKAEGRAGHVIARLGPYLMLLKLSIFIPFSSFALLNTKHLLLRIFQLTALSILAEIAYKPGGEVIAKVTCNSPLTDAMNCTASKSRVFPFASEIDKLANHSLFIAHSNSSRDTQPRIL